MFKRFFSTKISSSALENVNITTPILTKLSPSITKVQLVPSYPIFISKGSLLSIYSNKLSSISISNYYLEPVKRIINGLHSFKFEKVESTIPTIVLISSSLSNTKILKLDGTKDWAVLPRDAILGYSGLSLNVQTKKLPKVINKRLKWFNFPTKIKTGLSTPFKNGYSFISGRGDLLLKGEGELFTIELSKDEEFLIKRDNLIGISINEDLSECCEEYEIKKIKEEELEVEPIVPNDEVTEVVKKNETLEKFKDYFKSISLGFNKLIKAINNQLPSNNEYIKISGPREVIIKSKSGLKMVKVEDK